MNTDTARASFRFGARPLHDRGLPPDRTRRGPARPEPGTGRRPLAAIARCAAMLLAATSAAPAAGNDGLIASDEPGWPQWRGPRRDGVCDETGLLDRWPEGGPELLWQVDGLGRGWSCPVISRGTLYITGDVGRRCRVFAFDLAGKPQWTADNGLAWTKSYPGARACCLIDDGHVYHMNGHGRVACYDANTGREVWSVNTLERFEADRIRWGHSECLLADGAKLIVTPGGRKALLAALDKRTGETVWQSQPLGEDRAAYVSPILFRYGGRRHVVGGSSHHAFGADAETGRLQWHVPRPTRFQAIATTPLYHGDSVVVSSPDKRPTERLKLTVGGERTTVAPVWLAELNEMSGGLVYRDGRLFGADYRGRVGWVALDWKTGRTLYNLTGLARGAVLWADGLLHCVSQNGEAALLEPLADRFETRGRFRFATPRGRKKIRDAWAHPVIHRGRLYLRYHDTLRCYDVGARR